MQFPTNHVIRTLIFELDSIFESVEYNYTLLHGALVLKGFMYVTEGSYKKLYVKHGFAIKTARWRHSLQSEFDRFSKQKGGVCPEVYYLSQFSDTNYLILEFIQGTWSFKDPYDMGNLEDCSELELCFYRHTNLIPLIGLSDYVTTNSIWGMFIKFCKDCRNANLNIYNERRFYLSNIKQGFNVDVAFLFEFKGLNELFDFVLECSLYDNHIGNFAIKDGRLIVIDG